MTKPRQKPKPKPETCYFQLLLNRVEQLDRLAAPYLSNRPDKSLEELWIENTRLGYKWFKEANEDWDAVPEVVANIADGHTPFGPDRQRNGSLRYALGLSLQSLEAHAWQLNDFLRRKTTESELPFEIVADVDISALSP